MNTAEFKMRDPDCGIPLTEHVAPMTLSSVRIVLLAPHLKRARGIHVAGADGDIFRIRFYAIDNKFQASFPIRSCMRVKHGDLRGALHRDLLKTVIIGEPVKRKIQLLRVVLIPVPGRIAASEIVDQRQRRPRVGLVVFSGDRVICCRFHGRSQKRRQQHCQQCGVCSPKPSVL